MGDNNLLMVNSHVAHDCHVGSNTILANNVMLAGHVVVGDNAYLSGAVGVHQFCRVGTFAMVGGQAHIVKDVPPYVTVDGVSSMIVGLNRVGMKRAGVTRDELDELKAAYRVAFRSGLRWETCLEELRMQFPTGRAAEFYRFMSDTRRGCIQERSVPRNATLRLHTTTEVGDSSIDIDAAEGTLTRERPLSSFSSRSCRLPTECRSLARPTTPAFSRSVPAITADICARPVVRSAA